VHSDGEAPTHRAPGYPVVVSLMVFAVRAPGVT
jgi:hypothetical protein